MGEGGQRFGDGGLKYTALYERIVSFGESIRRVEEGVQLSKRIERELVQQKGILEEKLKQIKIEKEKELIQNELKDIRDALTLLLKTEQRSQDRHTELEVKIQRLEERLRNILEQSVIPEA